jgi:hypothetical protein
MQTLTYILEALVPILFVCTSCAIINALSK